MFCFKIYFWNLIGETRIEFDVNYLSRKLDEWHEIMFGIEICQYCEYLWSFKSYKLKQKWLIISTFFMRKIWILCLQRNKTSNMTSNIYTFYGKYLIYVCSRKSVLLFRSTVESLCQHFNVVFIKSYPTECLLF